jgi:hypothetical protein
MIFLENSADHVSSMSANDHPQRLIIIPTGRFSSRVINFLDDIRPSWTNIVLLDRKSDAVGCMSIVHIK